MDEEAYLYILNHIEQRMKHYPEGGDRDAKWNFFSGLDDSYRRTKIVDPLLESIWMPNIILTGQFGHYAVKRLESLGLKKDYILFNGHIREGDKPVELAYVTQTRDLFKPMVQSWMLVDDSNYSGRTRFVIEDYMIKNHSHPITSTVVIYNGSPSFNPQINSLYNWYMVHGLEVKK